jgi:hypothetical protein
MSPSLTGPGSWMPENTSNGPLGVPVPRETKARGREAVFLSPRSAPEMNGVQAHSAEQRSWAMWELINALYREYCRARLSEMRKFGLAR